MRICLPWPRHPTQPCLPIRPKHAHRFRTRPTKSSSIAWQKDFLNILTSRSEADRPHRPQRQQQRRRLQQLPASTKTRTLTTDVRVTSTMTTTKLASTKRTCNNIASGKTSYQLYSALLSQRRWRNYSSQRLLNYRIGLFTMLKKASVF